MWIKFRELRIFKVFEFCNNFTDWVTRKHWLLVKIRFRLCKICGLSACNLTKIGHYYRCFPVNFLKIYPNSLFTKNIWSSTSKFFNTWIHLNIYIIDRSRKVSRPLTREVTYSSKILNYRWLICLIYKYL